MLRSSLAPLLFVTLVSGSSGTEIICEGTAKTLTCPPGQQIKVLDANYGRTDAGVCLHKSIKNTNCRAQNSLQIVSQMCDGKNSCELRPSNSQFGDPCQGTYKYLEIAFDCNGGGANGVEKVAQACEKSSAVASCAQGEAIQVRRVLYGRNSPHLCPGPMRTHSCGLDSPNTANIVSNSCNGKQYCNLTASNSIFGDPCPGTYKYLMIHYVCVPMPSTPHDIHEGTGNKIVACEGEPLDLHCNEGEVITVNDANFGRTRDDICRKGPIRTTNCVSHNSLHVVKGNCEGKHSCTLKTDTQTFGEPCANTFKYLEVDITCQPCRDCGEGGVDGGEGPGPGSEVAEETACEGESLSLECGPEERLQIEGALYGRTNMATCPHGHILEADCYGDDTLDIVKNRCEGQQRCTLSADSETFGNPCFKTIKYLSVKYSCIL